MNWLRQIVNHLFWFSPDFCNFWGLAISTLFFLLSLQCVGFLSPSLLHLLPPLLPPLFWKSHLLKKSPVIHLECGFWLCLTIMLFDVFPRPSSHQIPGLGVFPQHSEAYKVNLPCIIDVKGWWGLLFSCVLIGRKNCQNLSVVVDTFTREFLCMFRKELRAVMPERL